MRIPGIVSGKKNIYQPGPYYTSFLMNFENGDGTTPASDDTSTATLSWDNATIKDSPTSPGPRFGNGFLKHTSYPSTGYLKTNNLSAYNIGGTRFCLECFLYVNSNGSLSFGIFNGDLTDGNDYLIIKGTPPNSGNNTYTIERKRNGTVTNSGYGGWIGYHQYIHVALNSDGVNYYLYINGALYSSFSDSLTVSSNNYKIWLSGVSFEEFDSVRFVTGSSVYDGAFTPPSSALTAISG